MPVYTGPSWTPATAPLPPRRCRHRLLLLCFPNTPYFVPAATMVYTDLPTLRGLQGPANYGSGIQYMRALVDKFPPNRGVQIGLWLNGTTGCRHILQGDWGKSLLNLFGYLLGVKHDRRLLPNPTPTMRTPAKTFLRVGYEFNNPSFGYSDAPHIYCRAFRRIVSMCEDLVGHKACHDSVAFVWHSWAAPRVPHMLDDFYPRDSVVDWVGVSIFQQLYPWANNNHGNDSNSFAGGNLAQVEEVLEFAKRHKKPIMIAGSNPFGGMDVGVQHGFEESIWSLWFEKTLQLIDRYGIGMWSYINCDWEAQPMWHGVGFGDTHLSSSKAVMDQWWSKVLKVGETRFLNHLECGDGAGGSISSSGQILVKSHSGSNIEESMAAVLPRGVAFQSISNSGMTMTVLSVISLLLMFLFRRRTSAPRWQQRGSRIQESREIASTSLTASAITTYGSI